MTNEYRGLINWSKIKSNVHIYTDLESKLTGMKVIHGIVSSCGDFMKIGGLDIPIYRDTLAVKINNAFDSKRTPIFMSLQEDGKGGDILLHKRALDLNDPKRYLWVIKWNNDRLKVVGLREHWNPTNVELIDLLTPGKSEMVGIYLDKDLNAMRERTCIDHNTNKEDKCQDK